MAKSPSEQEAMDACPQRPPLFIAPQPLESQTHRKPIRKLFIANRGEIACRVIATCRKLHIETVTIYVKEDEKSRHVLEATEAINVGSIEDHAVSPYLNIDLIVQTAVDTGSDALHPGYGYLSENGEFATRVQSAGLIFVGPSPTAMSTLGDKRSSKAYLQKHAPDVPLIPGFSGTSVQPDDLEKAAAQVGYPVMLKASAGGGGKGMRIVREPAQLRDELTRVQSEASRSFGSSDCILERFVESSKHVEIQIIGDKHGNALSFFERDCSVQRRHQKVIEESPCPFLTEEVRRRMGDTAVRIAKLIGYENAGTVEFVLDVSTSEFYFLEVNARLQVEHPISEETTGVDLVALQLYVAAGGNLQWLPRLKNLKQTGHAIECRLCAEDPGNDFFPEHGEIHLWRPADGDLAPGRDVRYETAVQTGSTVSIYFDSMIAKIVVWATTRREAIQKMRDVLAQTACIGVKTNQLFLQSCLTHEEFQNPRYNTSFIPQNLKSLLRPTYTNKTERLRDAETIIPSLFLRRLSQDFGIGQSYPPPFSNVRAHFRNQRYDPVNVPCDVITAKFQSSANMSDNMTEETRICLWNSEASLPSSRGLQVKVVTLPELKTFVETDNKGVNPKSRNQAARAGTDMYYHISNMLRYGQADLSVIEANVLRWEPAHGNHHRLNGTVAATITVSVHHSKVVAHCVMPRRGGGNSVDEKQVILCHFPHLGTWVTFWKNSVLSYIEGCRSQASPQGAAGRNSITAPMPCKVLSILKGTGDEVEVGEPIMVIESMKMEVSIKAEAKGKFETMWREGDAVEEGKILCAVA